LEGKDAIVVSERRYMRTADLRAVLDGLLFKRGEEFIAPDTRCEAWNIVAGRDPPRSRMAILEYQTATPKSAKINRRGESSGSCPNHDSVVDLSLFIHDVAPNRQMSESSPI
jgi:hypothetical protein